MKIHRFIGQFDFKDDKVVISDKEIAVQIGNVLKLKKGEEIILGDGDGNEKLIEIIEVNKNYINGKVLKSYKNKSESEAYGILYCAVLKKENFELVVQKATEVGIKEILPILTKKTVKLNLNYERLEKISKEAAEQSGRGIVPKINEIINFEDAIKNLKPDSKNFFCDVSGIKLYNIELDNFKTVSVWIGPEGGWDESEIKMAKENNFEIISLGKTTLRAETAAIISSYLISNRPFA